MNSIFKVQGFFQLRTFLLYFKATFQAAKTYPLSTVLRSFTTDFFKWWNTIKRDPKLLEFDMPWINFSAKKNLDRIINKEMIIYELGSGSSTVYFSRRVKKVYSVEHDKDWFLFISDFLKKSLIENVTYQLHEVEDNTETGASFLPENPDHYTSSDKHFANKNFKKYSTNIDQYEDEFFDLILVDGRNRNSCIKHALPKLKRNGYLILDNAERKHYTKYFTELEDSHLWEKSTFVGPVPYNFFYSQTNFYKKL